jgi:Icc-related predicted phosphoesterase
MTRIVALSDMHGQLPSNVPDADLLIIAGDVTPATDHHVSFQARWLDTTFRRWLESQTAPAIVGIAGNHDFVFQEKPAGFDPHRWKWHYLEESHIDVAGVRIFGTPWQPWFLEWAFNAPRERGEEFLAQIYSRIPEDTDIIVSHGPPRGYGDRVPPNLKSFNAGLNVGSVSLLEAIYRVKPRLVVCGHIHSGYGVYTVETGAPYPTTIANASLLNEGYRMVNKPVVLKLEKNAAGAE